MEEIIKYFADVFITNLYDAKIDFYKNPQSLAELVIATKKETDELGRLFIQSVLQEMDTLLKEFTFQRTQIQMRRKNYATC